MLRGTIYITTDVNLCISNLNNCKIITVADEPCNWNIPGKIGGSILLPPYQALAALVDDEYRKFEYEYVNYLLNDIAVNKFIDILLQALIVGTNIILFIEPEAPKFDGVLREFFASNFGIYIGDGTSEFRYDLKYIPPILSRLYANDSIEKEYFLKLFPENILFDHFDRFILRKLCYDYNMQFRTDIDAEVYFKKLSKILKNGGLIKGVVRRL